MDRIELVEKNQKRLEGFIRDLQESVILQFGLLNAQSRAIVQHTEQLRKVIGSLCKMQKTINVLITNHNKKYDEKLDEMTDIVIDKQKFKM